MITLISRYDTKTRRYQKRRGRPKDIKVVKAFQDSREATRNADEGIDADEAAPLGSVLKVLGTKIKLSTVMRLLWRL